MPVALRILSRFWLEELCPDDLKMVQAIPSIAETLPDITPATLTDLAVEYQRLFGFNLPPYESVFIDPSAMLMAPASERVLALYRRGGWHVPSESRAGAPDHIGLELLALADWLEGDQQALANQLQGHHLALWVPPFILALRRLAPHPFYLALADLTLDLLLDLLSDAAVPQDRLLFPSLPPSIFRTSGEETDADQETPVSPPDSDDLASGNLRSIIKRLLPPREAGLFLTREDLVKAGAALSLPPVVGDRFRMLDSLFRQAAQYNLLPDLFKQLNTQLVQAESAYLNLAEEYPRWRPYALAWQSRLAETQMLLNKMQAAAV